MTGRRAAIVAIAVCAIAAPVAADPRAEAIALFDQGIKDLKAGRLEKACAALQASLQLVKDSGTRGALARCHGRAGRFATAWLLWRELADTAPTAELRADAAAQAAKLERRLPRYTIKLAGPTPGLVVQINGREVALDVPVAVPIDPGPVAVTAVGRDGDRATTRTWSHELTAIEGETLAIEIPVLEPLATTPVATRPAPPPAAELDERAQRRAMQELADRRRSRHRIALISGAAALAAGGAGAVFGYQARSRYDDARRLCGDIDRCASDQLGGAQDRVDAARRSALYADISFGVAGVAAAIAVYAWLSAPSLERAQLAVAPSIASGAVGVVLGGSF